MRTSILVHALVIGLVLGASVNAEEVDIVVVVSSSSPVTELEAGRIADIFLGRNSRFPDGTVAIPIDQAENSLELAQFYTRFTGHTPAQMNMHWSKLIFTGRGHPPRRVSDSQAVKNMLASNPRVIGYIDRRFVDETVTILAD